MAGTQCVFHGHKQEAASWDYDITDSVDNSLVFVNMWFVASLGCLESCSRTSEDGKDGPQGRIQMVPTVWLELLMIRLVLSQSAFFAL